MSSQPTATATRAKFKTTLDWANFIASGQKTGADLYALRQN
jgi:hypothetical protein